MDAQAARALQPSSSVALSVDGQRAASAAMLTASPEGPRAPHTSWCCSSSQAERKRKELKNEKWEAGRGSDASSWHLV